MRCIGRLLVQVKGLLMCVWSVLVGIVRRRRRRSASCCEPPTSIEVQRVPATGTMPSAEADWNWEERGPPSVADRILEYRQSRCQPADQPDTAHDYFQDMTPSVKRPPVLNLASLKERHEAGTTSRLAYIEESPPQTSELVDWEDGCEVGGWDDADVVAPDQRRPPMASSKTPIRLGRPVR